MVAIFVMSLFSSLMHLFAGCGGFLAAEG